MDKNGCLQEFSIIETVEEFDEFKHNLHMLRDTSEELRTFQHITSVELLKAFLDFHRNRSTAFIHSICAHFCLRYRYDFMRCFLDYVSFEWFFNKDAPDNYNKLLKSIARQAPRIFISFLIDNGLKVDGVDSRGRTMLHEACCRGRVDVIGDLLIHGADATKKDDYGESPLFSAIYSGEAEAFNELLSSGVKVTSSFWARAVAHRKLDIVECLVAASVPLEPKLIELALGIYYLEGEEKEGREMITLLRSVGCEEPTRERLLLRFDKDYLQKMLD